MSLHAERLRPAQVFARGWRLWWGNLGQLVIGTLVVYVPMQVLALAVAYFTQPGLVDQLEAYPQLFQWAEQLSTNPDAPPPAALSEVPSGAEYSLMLLGQALTLLITVFGTALFLSIAVEIALRDASGERLGWRPALDAAVARVRPMAMVTFLWGFFLTLAFMAAIFIAMFPIVIAGSVGGVWALVVAIPLALLVTLAPCVWLLVMWAVPVPVLIEEGARNFEALGRSFRLVRGRAWATSGALGLLALVQLVVGIVLAAVPTALLFSGADIVLSIAALIVSGAVWTVIVYPQLGAVIASIYSDLRGREGPAQG